MTTGLTAAGASHAGLQRGENQDRFHLDLARVLFIVIDGVGGHPPQQGATWRCRRCAAGWSANRPGDDRIREGHHDANNEIHRVAASRPEWLGMACVLT